MHLLCDWLDDRTGYRQALARRRARVLPNGPGWRYTTASCLLWLLVVQGITGLLLMATYSPSPASAWGSVQFIEQHAAGAFLRGIHFYAAQAMIILLGIHVIRALVAGAFRAPNELVWITGLAILPLVLAWMVSGNPLPGTQKGLAQIDVEAKIIDGIPAAGPFVRQLLIGGSQVGELTFTRLYFLHVALLPLLVGALLTFHLWQVRRHGLAVGQIGEFGTATAERSADRPPPLPYWPHQTVRNMIALGLVLGTVAVLAWVRGAPLDMPADPELEHSPRPEWYFLSLFELRRYFTGERELIATVIIPGAVLLFLLALPLLDRLCSRRISILLRVITVLGGVGVGGWLTAAVLVRDGKDVHHQAAIREEERLSERARVLADYRGIPPEGAIRLLREDPPVQGPKLFARHCASCHPHVDSNGQGIAAATPVAPNLYGFASRAWIEGLLDPQKIAGHEYFGNTAMAEGDMVSAVTAAFEGAETEDDQQEVRAQLQQAAWTLSAEAALPAQTAADHRDAHAIAEGAELLAGEFGLGCTDCHRFHGQGELGSAPDLTGYGSREWLVGMVRDPNHERFYADERNDGMPAFAAPDKPDENILTAGEVELLADWLRGEWYEPGKK